MEPTIEAIDIFPKVVYAEFGQRVIASLIDGFILTPLNFGLIYYCLIYSKSYALSLVPMLITLLYKCIMEKELGWTPGKKIKGIRVISEDLKPLTYKEVFTRNYYYVAAFILALYSHYVVYSMPGLEFVSTYMEAIKFQANAPATPRTIGYVLSLLFFVDALMMVKNAKNQTLHDRLGKTLVIQNKSI